MVEAEFLSIPTKFISAVLGCVVVLVISVSSLFVWIGSRQVRVRKPSVSLEEKVISPRSRRRQRQHFFRTHTPDVEYGMNEFALNEMKSKQKEFSEIDAFVKGLNDTDHFVYSILSQVKIFSYLTPTIVRELMRYVFDITHILV